MATFIARVGGGPRALSGSTVVVTSSRLTLRGPFVVGVVCVPWAMFRSLSRGHFLEWARDIILAMRSHLKAESERGGRDPVSTRLRDAHIELHLMLVRAPPTPASLMLALAGT